MSNSRRLLSEFAMDELDEMVTTGDGGMPLQEHWTSSPVLVPIPVIPPPGLNDLLQLDHLLVHEEADVDVLAEVFRCIETENKYCIKNSMGQQIYFAAEESDCCTRTWCGRERTFIMHINNFNQEVIRVVREYKCCAGCCWCATGGSGTTCCAVELSVEAPVGQVVGYVRQLRSACLSKYVLQNAQQEAIFFINGHVCLCQSVCCTGDIEFPVMSFKDEHVEVGKISKHWTGFANAMLKTSHFSVSFPVDLDVRMKAVTIAAVFLIDLMHFKEDKRAQCLHVLLSLAA